MLAVARQKRLRIGDECYRLDLLLYHPALRCVVVVDLKLGTFTHADAVDQYAMGGISAQAFASRYLTVLLATNADQGIFSALSKRP